MSAFKKVAVLMGGPSAERDVSIRSGQAVSRGLREAGYEVTEVEIAGRQFDLPPGTEAVFIALHGEFGEDGTVQSLLAARGIPYTGSGPDASRISFDKRASKRLMEAHGIPTPAWEVLRRGEPRRLPLPVVVKPPCQGSTIGIARALTPDAWPAAAEEAFRFADEIIVEAYIEGRELTCGIVGDQALPVIEIVAPGGWYGFQEKYTKGVTEYLVPAPLEPGVSTACRELAMRTFRVLGCRGLGRVDFRLMADGRLYTLEMNTIPGFTETSLLPKAAKAAGLAFPALCDRIMRMAAP